jgi:hypothetical protein
MNRLLAFAALVVLGATGTAAAQSGPPLAGQLLETCNRFATNDPAAADVATRQGWAITPGGKPAESALQYQNGTRTIAGFGDAVLYASTETYPNGTLRYCRIDVTTTSDVGFRRFGERTDLSGSLSDTENGVFGSWTRQETMAGRLYLLAAEQAGATFLQVTVIDLN